MWKDCEGQKSVIAAEVKFGAFPGKNANFTPRMIINRVFRDVKAGVILKSSIRTHKTAMPTLSQRCRSQSNSVC